MGDCGGSLEFGSALFLSLGFATEACAGTPFSLYISGLELGVQLQEVCLVDILCGDTASTGFYKVKFDECSCQGLEYLEIILFLDKV